MGKKWTIPIIELLYPPRNKISFNNMLIGLNGNVTARNLSQSLKELSKIGIIEKVERKENRFVYTEYSLTKKGMALKGFIRNAKVLGACIYDLDASCADRPCSECLLFSKSRLPSKQMRL